MNVNEVLVVREHAGQRYMLWISYEDGDSGNAVGYLYRTDARRGAPTPTSLLNTNDTLRND